MKDVLILGAIAGLTALVVGCGGGTSSSDKTATAGAGNPTAAAPTKAAASPTKAAASPTKAAEAPTVSAGATSAAAPSKAELAQYVTDLKAIMQQIVAKAQAGDVQGTRDTEATMDTAIEATVKATRVVDPALADSIEKLELEIEAQADASTTDLTIIIKDAQAIPALLDQVVTTLKLNQ